MRRGRLALGGVLFVLSLVPWAVVPVIPFLGFETPRAATLVAGSILGAEAIGLLALVVLGREAYGGLRTRLRRRRKEQLRCAH